MDFYYNFKENERDLSDNYNDEKENIFICNPWDYEQKQYHKYTSTLHDPHYMILWNEMFVNAKVSWKQ